MLAAHAANLTTNEPTAASAIRDPVIDARLRELATEHYDFVWRSLRRLGVAPPETDDATQRVFLILAQKLHSIERGKERSYVFGTVMRVAANTRRDRALARRREVPECDTAEPLSQGPTAENALARAEERATLDEILACIPDERRVVFVLFELEELTLVEIAGLLDAPVGTVTSRLRRAREEFRAAVTRLRARNQGV